MGKIETIVDGVKTIANVADKLHTSADEAESHIDNRHSVDMASDSKLSKAIRPVMLIACFVAFIAFSVLGIWFPVAVVLPLEISKTLLITAFMFFFGGRSIEKMTRVAGRVERIERRDIRKTKRQERKDNK